MLPLRAHLLLQSAGKRALRTTASSVGCTPTGHLPAQLILGAPHLICLPLPCSFLGCQDLVGFRTPLLAHNPPVRQALAQAGFLYDSSIPEVWPGATSPNATARLWPYTMDYGIPQVRTA